MSNEKKMSGIGVHKSLLKEYTTSKWLRTVYLNDGDEFQIKLFNPYQERIGVELSVNGNDLGNMIIVEPGQTVWLERFLKESRKFLFKTYEVENGNSDVENAIKNNGLIEFRFYKEGDEWYNVITMNNYPNTTWTNTDLAYTFNTSSTGNVSYPVSSVNTSYCDVNALLYCDVNSGIKSTVSGMNELGSSYYASSSIKDDGVKKTKYRNTKETGRVEKGDYSTQNFSTTEFRNPTIFDSTSILILPESEKPYTKGDLQKQYCTECGRKVNSKFKYCPYCGGKL
jgi:hypothetical protein